MLRAPKKDPKNEPKKHKKKKAINAPSVVKECLQDWNDGAALDINARRLFDRDASCADRHPHIWFCPPSPEEVKGTTRNSVLEHYHQNLSRTECWYHTMTRKRRRLTMEDVKHNTLPLKDYAINAVNAWLTEFPIFLQLKSASPTFSDNCQVELQDELLQQTHSISIKDLKRLTGYHKLASEIATATAAKKMT